MRSKRSESKRQMGKKVGLVAVLALIVAATLLTLVLAFRAYHMPRGLSGGILVTFDVQDETMKVWITNQKTIEDVFAAFEGRSNATIPNGKLVRGSAYGNPWSWHLDPEDIEMAELTIEIYDGLPSEVERDLDYWLNTVNRFAPWSARMVQIQDLR